VWPDPEPEHTVGDVSPERAVSEADSNRPITRNLLEMQRWVPVVILEKLVVAASEHLNVRRKAVKRLPEVR
jgi:hypothetical protein